MNAEKKALLSVRMRQLKFIWLSIIASVCVIAGAAVAVVSQDLTQTPLTEDEARQAVKALAGMAVLLIIGGYFAGERFLARYRSHRLGGLALDEREREFWFKPEEERMEAIFPAYFQAGLIRWASGEGVGVFGFFCVMLAGEDYLLHGAGFWAVSLGLLLYYAPSEKELNALAGGGKSL